MHLRQTLPRTGAVTVEAAVVMPVMMFLFLGMVVGGMGVFRYQQVACLAREAARWACVRGCDYQKDSDVTAPSTSQIQQQAMLPFAVGMDSSKLAISVQWIDQGGNVVQDWDAAPKDVMSINSSGEYVTNAVRVTVSYTWSPGMFCGDIVLRSVSQQPMSY